MFVTDVACIGLTQFADSQQISLARKPPQAPRDLPVHGTTAGRIAEIALGSGASCGLEWQADGRSG